MIMPSVKDCSTPSVPKRVCSTAAVSETQSHTTSAPWAAAAGVGAMPAPSTNLPGVRFQTVTSWPALARFVAIDCPMIPKPKNATRMSNISLRIKATFKLDMSGRSGSSTGGFQAPDRRKKHDRTRASGSPCKNLHIDSEVLSRYSFRSDLWVCRSRTHRRHGQAYADFRAEAVFLL